MSYEQGKVMNFKHGHKLLETVDQHKAEIGTVAKNWEDHKTEAFAVGEYVIKDNVTYRFKAAHAANTAWNASEVEETNLGSEITDLKSAIGTVPTGKTVQGQIEALQTGKADMIVVSDSTPAVIMSFPDGADGQPMKLEVAIDPVQDLHGYDYPWPAGGGKNKLGMTLAVIKASNTSGTWTDNSYAINGLTFNVLTDSDGNVTGINVTGTATARTDFVIGVAALDVGTEYAINGCPANGSDSTYRLTYVFGDNSSSHDRGSGNTFTGTDYESQRGYIRIGDGYAIASAGLTFYPMIRLASDTDATYEQPTNICHISGWTGAKVTRTGKNLVFKSENALVNSSGVYGASSNYKQFIAKVESGKTYIASGNTDTSGIIVAFFYDIPEVGDYSYNKSRSTRGEKTFTAPITGYASLRTAPSDTQVQIEEGTVASPYEAPAVEYPISWQTEAGTVHGGALEVYKDGTGKLVADSICKEFDGTEGTTIIKEISSSGTVKINSSAFDNKTIRNVGSSAIINADHIASSMLKVKLANAWSSAAVSDFSFGVIQNTAWFRINDDTFSDAQSVLTWMAQMKALGTPLQLMYELVTPESFNLTASQVKSLLGLNNVWADTGNINSVEYSADTKLYIDGKIADAIANILNA